VGYVRTVRTGSGATAVQIVHGSRRVRFTAILLRPAACATHGDRAAHSAGRTGGRRATGQPPQLIASDVRAYEEVSVKVSHIPLRVAIGAFILNSGLSKQGLEGQAAEGVHAMAASVRQRDAKPRSADSRAGDLGRSQAQSRTS
jgi:hypothetical protein